MSRLQTIQEPQDVKRINDLIIEFDEIIFSIFDGRPEIKKVYALTKQGDFVEIYEQDCSINESGHIDGLSLMNQGTYDFYDGRANNALHKDDTALARIEEVKLHDDT